MQHIPLALTFDDVLIQPKRSTLDTRAKANTKTRLTKKLTINIPIVSANMDTVSESELAITLARLGGISLIHRFMSVKDNVEEIKRVKRAQNFIILNPYTIELNKTLQEAIDFSIECGVSGLIVTDADNRLMGVLAERDFMFINSSKLLIKDIMTPRDKLITGKPNLTYDEAKQIIIKNKIEKIPLVDEDDRVVGLVTADDLRHSIDYPNANIDDHGQLRVGGSIGVKGEFLERAKALIEAGADVLVVDIAHGHSDLMFNAITKVKEVCPQVELIAGNIATAQAARELAETGLVDCLKVGVGPGASCITRTVTGCGVPQLTAVLEVSKVAKEYDIPVIADGGIQKSGDIVKAIGAGADSVMIGSLFAGVKESPGDLMNKNGTKFKVYRGSASFSVAQRRKKLQQETKELNEVVPEGVESIIPYKGELKEILGQLVGGLKSGMSYTNSYTITDLQKNTEFVRISSAGLKESGHHDLPGVAK